MDFGAVAETVDFAARVLALTAASLAGGVALTHWAVRRRHLTPLNPLARWVRRLSDPALRPVEKSVVRRGGNTQDASYWLFGIAVVGGLLLLLVTRWATGFVSSLLLLGSASPIVWLRVLIQWAFSLVMAAIVVRVIASWVGISRYSGWMRPVFWLTDWIIEPLRRRLPPWGMIDMSPFVAYVVLFLARALILGGLQ